MTSQNAFENFSVLDDDDKVLGRVRDQADVSNRIAVDEEKISKGALFDHTKFALRVGHMMVRVDVCKG